MMCKTYSYLSVFIADNQGFEGSDRGLIRAVDMGHNIVGDEGAVALGRVLNQTDIITLK